MADERTMTVTEDEQTLIECLRLMQELGYLGIEVAPNLRQPLTIEIEAVQIKDCNNIYHARNWLLKQQREQGEGVDT